MKRKPTTVRCHDCRFADIAQRGNNPAIAQCRAPGSEKPPQVAMARILCKLFEPDYESGKMKGPRGASLPGNAGGAKTTQ